MQTNQVSASNNPQTQGVTFPPLSFAPPPAVAKLQAVSDVHFHARNEGLLNKINAHTYNYPYIEPGNRISNLISLLQETVELEPIQQNLHVLILSFFKSCELAKNLPSLNENEILLLQALFNKVISTPHKNIFPYPCYPNTVFGNAENLFSSILDLYDRNSAKELSILGKEAAGFMSSVIISAQDAGSLEWLWHDRAGGKILNVLKNSIEHDQVTSALRHRLEQTAQANLSIDEKIAHSFLLAGLLSDADPTFNEWSMPVFQSLAEEIMPDSNFSQLDEILLFLAQHYLIQPDVIMSDEDNSAIFRNFINGLGMLGSTGVFRGFNQVHMDNLIRVLPCLDRSDYTCVPWLFRLAEQGKIPLPSDFLEFLINKLYTDEDAECQDADGAEIFRLLGLLAAKGHPLSLSSNGQEKLLYLLTLLMTNQCNAGRSEIKPFVLLETMGNFFNRGVLRSYDADFETAFLKFINSLFVLLEPSYKEKMICLFFFDSLLALGSPLSRGNRNASWHNLYQRLHKERLQSLILGQVTGKRKRE